MKEEKEEIAAFLSGVAISFLLAAVFSLAGCSNDLKTRARAAIPENLPAWQQYNLMTRCNHNDLECTFTNDGAVEFEALGIINLYRLDDVCDAQLTGLSCERFD